VVSAFAGSDPAEAVGFFGRKILSAPSFGGEVKRWSHVAALRHVKDPYNYRGIRNCKLNLLGHFSTIVLPFSARGLSSLAGKSKTQSRVVQSTYRLQCPLWGSPPALQ
jgi:hypothetical protein